MQKNTLFINRERLNAMCDRHKEQYLPDFRIDEHNKPSKNGRPARLWKHCDLAAVLHLTKQHFSKLVNGKEPADEKYLRQLGELWHCDWKWLCGISNEDNLSDAIDKETESLKKLRAHIDAQLSFFRFLGYDTTPFSDTSGDVTISFNGDPVIQMPAYKLLLILNNMMSSAASALHSQLSVLMANDELSARRYMPATDELLAMLSADQHSTKKATNYLLGAGWAAAAEEKVKHAGPADAEYRKDLEETLQFIKRQEKHG